MKTILYVSTNTKKDGAEKSLVALQNFLQHNKNLKTLTIIPRHGAIEELLSESEIEYIVYHFEGNVNFNRGTKILRGVTKATINYVQAVKLAHELKSKNYEIIGVHSNTVTSEFGCYLAEMLKVPHIWHIREYGKLDFGFDFELGWKYIGHRLAQAKKVVCNSKSVMEYYKSHITADNLTYIYNGVSIVPRGMNSWKNKTFKMLLIGRLSDEKGQEIAISACKKLMQNGYKDFELDLYGDGVNYEKYRTLIENYKLTEHVHLMGYSNNIPINEYHVGLMCSHHEAFGRVTVEYMVNGLPVIGIASGGTAEIVEDKITGYLIPVNDEAEFEKRIEELYKHREACIEMGLKGKERADKMFAETTYCQNIYNLYKQCGLLGE